MSTEDNHDTDDVSLTRDMNEFSNDSSSNDMAREILNDVHTLDVGGAASDADHVSDTDAKNDDDDTVEVIHTNDTNNDVSSSSSPPPQDDHVTEPSTLNDDSDDTPVVIKPQNLTPDKLLQQERQKSSQLEEKLKRALADYQNLHRKTITDIENGVTAKLNEFALDFIKIYDDFIRAKNVFIESKINTEGMNSILKNMDSVLTKYNIRHIDALGEIFDPHLHEAISVVPDPNLDEGTITQELRRGYTSNGIVIRPTLVEITKKE